MLNVYPNHIPAHVVSANFKLHQFQKHQKKHLAFGLLAYFSGRELLEKLFRVIGFPKDECRVNFNLCATVIGRDKDVQSTKVAVISI